MVQTYLERLKRTARQHNPDAVINYSKKHGYSLLLNDKESPLGKDSVEALFRLEKLLCFPVEK